MVIISRSNPQNIEAVKVFYSHCGYGGGVSNKDLILTAKLDKQIVGAVRLCPESGFFVLRGMQVLTPFQRQGIGTQLLQQCTKQLADRLCYCIPWQHLRSFYQRAGFKEVDRSIVPSLLQDRFDRYLSRGLKVILMSNKKSG